MIFYKIRIFTQYSKDTKDTTLLYPHNKIERLVNVETWMKIIKQNLRKAFGENIGNLMTRRHMKNANITTFDLFTNKINGHLNVFSALMIKRVARKINDTNIITINNNGNRNNSGNNIITINNSGKLRIQQVSETTLATPRYSASALYLETMGWRLKDRETNYPLKITRAKWATSIKTSTPISICKRQ